MFPENEFYWSGLSFLEIMSRDSEGLKLNSYKIDSNALKSNLRELNEIRSELETTISQYRMNEEKTIE